MRSSSGHRLNSDGGLSHFGKALWMALNALNNVWFPNAKDKSLALRDFAPDLSDEHWRQSHAGKGSPSRTLANLFLMQLPWDRMQDELGRINIVDVGCGSGNNGPRLQSWSGGRVATYSGVDARSHENWKNVESHHAECRFFCADADDIGNHLSGDANLIVSQSAIEHFRNDVHFFSAVRTFIGRSRKPALQLHLFPSAAGLRLYRWHGVRQYTPRTVSLLARMFNDCSCSRLYRLGGDACNVLHTELITAPLFARGRARSERRLPRAYGERLRAAIATDSTSVQGAPSFYALVIHSHARERIFR